jgi:hypothetical protein
MIPTFPNIIPAGGTKTSAADETTKLPDANGKKGESFASLMTSVLSPSGDGQPTKGSKTGAPESGKGHAKTTDTNVSGDPVIDPNAIMLVCPQNVSMPAPVPIAPKIYQKSDVAVELPTKAAPGIFSIDLKAELTVGSGKNLSPMVEAKNVSERVSQADLKVPSPKVPPKSPGGGPVSLAKIDDTQTNAPLGKAITSKKINPAGNNEMAALSTVKLAGPPIPKAPPLANPITSERLNPASNNDVSAISTIKLSDSIIPKAPTPTSAALAILAAPEKNEPATKSANEIKIKTTDLILPELAPKAVTAAIAATVATTATAGQIHVESFPDDTELENTEQLSLDEDGTSIAKEDVAMKKIDKLNKFAGATEKILPGNTIVIARENNLPARVDQSVGIGAVNSSTLGSDSTVPFLTADSIAGSSAIDSHSNTLENVHELVVQHAMRMNGSGGDSLQVVIKPGAGTQLSLELRQHGNGVVVQAVLQHGDFTHLNQNWPELQQRLEQRGIRLAPLTGDVNFAAGNGGHAFQQKQNQPAGALEEFAPAFSMTGTFARPVTNAATHRGWETWA